MTPRSARMSSSRLSTRLSRLLNMVPYFLANPGISAAEAAEDLGVTTKQLMNDLNQLWMCGLPGYGPGDLIDLSFSEESVEVTFSAGIEYPFQWKGIWLTSQLYLRYTASSVDPLLTLYWWKGFLNYRLEIAGDVSIWTQNAGGSKRFYFFAEPQLWYKFLQQLSAGTKINLYYPADTEGPLQIAPTVAVRWRL